MSLDHVILDQRLSFLLRTWRRINVSWSTTHRKWTCPRHWSAEKSADQITVFGPFCERLKLQQNIIHQFSASPYRCPQNKDSWPDGRCHSVRTSHQDFNFIKGSLVGKLPNYGVLNHHNHHHHHKLSPQHITTTTNYHHHKSPPPQISSIFWRKSRTKSSRGKVFPLVYRFSFLDLFGNFHPQLYTFFSSETSTPSSSGYYLYDDILWKILQLSSARQGGGQIVSSEMWLLIFHRQWVVEINEGPVKSFAGDLSFS